MSAARRLVFVLLALSMSAAIARPQQAGKPTAETGPGAWTDATQRSAEAWAKQFEAELRRGDEAAAEKVFDVESVAEAVIAGVESGENKLPGSFRRGLKRGLAGARGQLATQWSQSHPKFKRVLLVDGRPRARFRFQGESGLSIVDLHLESNGDSWRVVDFTNHAAGMRIVDQTRQSALLMLPQVEDGVLARLFGVGKVAREDARHVRKVFEARNRGDFAAALAEYEKLSKPLQQSPLVLMTQVQCLGALGDDEAYAAALERAAGLHPPPLFRMMLVDAHFLHQRWDEAIACVDQFMDGLERDAGLLALRASIELQAGRVDVANKTIGEALALEPDCTFALASGLDVWLAAKDWKSVRSAIEALEKTGEYDFHGQLVGEAWAGFVAAPESEPWR